MKCWWISFSLSCHCENYHLEGSLHWGKKYFSWDIYKMPLGCESPQTGIFSLLQLLHSSFPLAIHFTHGSVYVNPNLPMCPTFSFPHRVHMSVPTSVPLYYSPVSSVSSLVVSDSMWPHDCSPPSSSADGILQVRMLELVAVPFCRGSSQPWDQTWVSHTAGRFSTIWATREASFSLFLPCRQDHLCNFSRFDIHVLICIFSS